MTKNKTKPKAKRIHADEALPVWALDSGHDGLLEIYAVNGRLELRCDLSFVNDDEDTEEGLERLKEEAAGYAEANRE
jgi:hypothetical protein